MLGHLWTLSLEQQFYLFWPVLFGWFSPKKAAVLCGFLIIVCPAARVGSYYMFPSCRGYIGMFFHTAIDSLMVGCLFSILYHYFPARLESLLRRNSLTINAAVIWLLLASPLAGIWIRGFSVAAGISLDAIACGCVLVLLNKPTATWYHTVFSRGLLPRLGIISYSLYLWQQIFLSPWGYLGNGRIIPALALSLVAGFLSYTLIERPVLNWYSKRVTR
jgi:peptidoglycan/LPS O-acetylase OafA/YrhL